MSPRKWTDCIKKEPKHNHCVVQLSALPLRSSKSCVTLVLTALNQDPAPFLLHSYQPYSILYFVISQTDSAGSAFCFIFIWWAASCPPVQGDLLHMHFKLRKSCWCTATRCHWSPEPCLVKARAPTFFWALLKGMEWALLSHIGNYVESVQCQSSWPGKRQSVAHQLMEDNLPLV